MKIVKNSKYGGFSLSPLATKKYMERKGKECYFFSIDIKVGGGERFTPLTLAEAEKRGFFVSYTVPNPADYRLAELISTDIESRTDPDLIAVVEELGEKANGRCAQLEIVEIPDDLDWEIDEYDGIETIREKGRSW